MQKREQPNLINLFMLRLSRSYEAVAFFIPAPLNSIISAPDRLAVEYFESVGAMSALNPLAPHNPVDERPAHEPSMEEILASIRRIISDDQSLAAYRDHEREEESSASGPSVPQSPPAVPVWPYADTSIPEGRPNLSAVGSADNTRRASTNDRKSFGSISDLAAAAPDPLEYRRSGTFLKDAVSEAKPAVPKSVEPSFVELKPAELNSANLEPAHPKTADFIDMRLHPRFDEDMGRTPKPPVNQGMEPTPAAQNEEKPLVSAVTDAAVATSFNALLASRLMPNPEVLAEMTREMLRPMLKTWLDDNLPVMVERLVRAEIERVARGGR